MLLTMNISKKQKTHSCHEATVMGVNAVVGGKKNCKRF